MRPSFKKNLFTIKLEWQPMFDQLQNKMTILFPEKYLEKIESQFLLKKLSILIIFLLLQIS